jgi:AcrR family transcriptional regulator
MSVLMPAPRRRGEVLRDAVFSAALEELAENGLRGASMDRIARRAGTGKSALYRRWPNARALALDVFISTMEENLPTPETSTGSLRDDLLNSMTTLSKELEGSLGIVLRELISEGAHDPSLVEEFQVRFGLPKQAELVTLLQLAMARGEIPPQPIDPYVLQIPASMVMHSMVMTGACPSADEVGHIIDAIVLPLLKQPRKPPAA